MAEANTQQAATTADTSTAAATGTDATTATDKGVTTTTAAAAATTDKTTATTAATTAATGTTTDAAATTGASKGDWPDDWQSRLAGDDKGAAKDLGKFASPKALYESYSALQRRLSSGEFKAVLPKDAKPEELTAWRKDNGIPEKPEAYDLKLTAVKEIPKDAKPVIDAFLKSAHGANMTNEQASASVDAYLTIQKQEAQARLERDETQRGAALDKLAQEWGGAFTRNKNLVGNVLQMFPESVRDQVMSARLPDGTALFNHVDVLRAFVAMELRNNPAGIVAPGGGGDVGKTALEEYQTIQKSMRDNRAAYDKDTAKQARMTDLIGFLSKEGLIDNNGNVVQQKKAA